MYGKFVILLIVCVSFLNGNDSNTTKPIESLKTAYVNITSNVVATEVYMNGDFIGKTPINRHQIRIITSMRLRTKSSIKKILQKQSI
jgi:hypothetical protein